MAFVIILLVVLHSVIDELKITFSSDIWYDFLIIINEPLGRREYHMEIKKTIKSSI